jgi:hypothetical protein
MPERPDPRRPRGAAPPLLGLAFASCLALGAPCTAPTISITTPTPNLVVDDPSVSLAASVATAFDPLSVEVRVDGVDLIDALGLVPPFTNAAGTVSIGGQPVQVASFRYDTAAAGNPKPVSASLAGLPEGSHQLDVRGVRVSNGALVSALRSFTVSGPLGLALDVVPAAADRTAPMSGGGTLAYGTLGASLPGAPVPLADGGELRAGFVPAAEGRIAGSP